MFYRHEGYLTVVEVAPEAMEEFELPETLSPYMAMRTALDYRAESRDLGAHNLRELADLSAAAEERRVARTDRIERLMIVSSLLLDICHTEYEEYIAEFPDDADETLHPAVSPVVRSEKLIVVPINSFVPTVK